MNDLTFGATLLSCFATLALAVIVESSGAPAPRRPEAVASPVPAAATVRMALAGAADCDKAAAAKVAAR